MYPLLVKFYNKTMLRPIRRHRGLGQPGKLAQMYIRAMPAESISNL